jgi:uncharacterized protein YraI
MKGIAVGLSLCSLVVAACSRQPSAETAPEPTPTATQTAPAVQPTPTPPAKRTATVTADLLNIRQSPGTDAPILYGAPRGTQLDVLGEKAMGDSVWYQVKAISSDLPQTAGWAFSQYLSLSGAGGASPAASPQATLSTEPNLDDLSMTCAGSLSNGTKFTVSYTREAGFSQITFTPPSGASQSTTLTYAGKTESNHDVWKGKLSESEVRLDHLSTTAPKPGDSIYVLYNAFTGRTTCQ